MLDETNQMLNIELTESELEEQCDELFKIAPIEFRPRKNNQIDELVANLIEDKDYVIPILNIQDNFYLVGSSKVALEIDEDTLYV